MVLDHGHFYTFAAFYGKYHLLSNISVSNYCVDVTQKKITSSFNTQESETSLKGK